MTKQEKIEQYLKEPLKIGDYILVRGYGSHAWKINELANTLRNEEISESHFRELVRYQLEECFKEFKNEK